MQITNTFLSFIHLIEILEFMLQTQAKNGLLSVITTLLNNTEITVINYGEKALMLIIKTLCMELNINGLFVEFCPLQLNRVNITSRVCHWYYLQLLVTYEVLIHSRNPLRFVTCFFYSNSRLLSGTQKISYLQKTKAFLLFFCLNTYSLSYIIHQL